MDNTRELRIVFLTIPPKLQASERFPLVGVGYLMEYIEAKLPHAKCCFFSEIDLPALRELKPDIIGFSSTTPAYGLNLEAAQSLRKEFPNSLFVLGGPHVTILPDVITNSPFDLGVIGEGEETMLEIARLQSAGNLAEQLSAILGIVYQNQSGEMVQNERRPLIENLDNVPRLRIDRITTDSTVQENILITSRGCPYKCAFCSSSNLWQGVRFHSAEYVAEDIVRRYEETGVTEFFPKDDLFSIRLTRLNKIADLLEKKNLLKKLKFSAVKTRANTVSEETCLALKRLNVSSVSMGFESASPRILKLIKDGPASPAMYSEAISQVRKYGMYVLGTFIIGNPTETHEDIAMTYEFIRDHDISSPHTFIASPYPGTKLWDMACERGIVNNDFDFNLLTQNNVFFTDNLTKEEIYEWQQKFIELRKQKQLQNKWRHRIQLLKDPKKLFARLAQKTAKMIQKN